MPQEALEVYAHIHQGLIQPILRPVREPITSQVQGRSVTVPEQVAIILLLPEGLPERMVPIHTAVHHALSTTAVVHAAVEAAAVEAAAVVEVAGEVPR